MYAQQGLRAKEALVEERVCPKMMGSKGAALLALGALAVWEMAAAVDPNPVFPKVDRRACSPLPVPVACRRAHARAPQAWHADYDYVATGEITQDGNGTLSYDLDQGNGHERSSKSATPRAAARHTARVPRPAAR